MSDFRKMYRQDWCPGPARVDGHRLPCSLLVDHPGDCAAGTGALARHRAESGACERSGCNCAGVVVTPQPSDSAATPLYGPPPPPDHDQRCEFYNTKRGVLYHAHDLPRCPERSVGSVGKASDPKYGCHKHLISWRVQRTVESW